MRRGLQAVAAAVLVAPGAAADVLPETVAITNRRAEAVQAITNVAPYKGQALLLTNCTAYAASGVQDLTDVAVTVTVGDAGNRASATGAAIVATNGTWYALVTVPSALVGTTATIQTKLTDAATNVYIYPPKTITVREAL